MTVPQSRAPCDTKARMDVEQAAQVGEQIVAAMNRRDPGPFLGVVNPDFEGASALVEAEGGMAFRGVEGAKAWFDNLLEVYERLQASIEQTVAVGEHALYLVRVEFVGKGSGVALEARVAWVVETRGGRIAFMHSHLDVAEAFYEMGRRLARTSSAA